jgi:hypothetical protein
MAITFAELKTAARERADMKNSNFVEDSELAYYINSSIAELHDMLIQTYGSEYYIKEVEFQTTPRQGEYELNTIIPDQDFYKLRAVDARLNGDDWFTLKRFNFNERNRFQNFGVWDYLGITNVRYRIMGNKIILSPIPDNNIDVRLWYIPLATELINDSDELQDLNQYSEYVIVDAAIKMLNKEESDVSVLMAQKQALKRRIEEAAQNRDAGDPESISDIYIENDDFFYGRTRS